jgi:hypothetical protein
MIIALAIILVVLIIALWISTMALWWKHEQGQVTKTIKRGDVIHAWNKAARIARRSWYEGQRYGRKAALWGKRNATNTFIKVFPKSKSAFVTQDPLTGLEHGPSSYFLANLSKPAKKTRKKKVSQAEDLSV